MIIDFKNMEEKPVECFKGGIGITNLRKFENELGKIILGRLEPGATIGLHTHETNSEAIYIVSGTADFIYDPEPANGSQAASAAEDSQAGSNAEDNSADSAAPEYETVSAGGCHYCPKGHTHSMVNNSSEDIVFFAVIPEQ